MKKLSLLFVGAALSMCAVMGLKEKPTEAKAELVPILTAVTSEDQIKVGSKVLLATDVGGGQYFAISTEPDGDAPQSVQVDITKYDSYGENLFIIEKPYSDEYSLVTTNGDYLWHRIWFNNIQIKLSDSPSDGTDYLLENGISSSPNLLFISQTGKASGCFFVCDETGISLVNETNYNPVVFVYEEIEAAGDTVEQFIADWKAMRTDGGEGENGGICTFVKGDRTRLQELLDRFEKFSDNEKSIIRNTTDFGSGQDGESDVTIGETMDYIKNVWGMSGSSDTNSNGLNGIVLSTNSETTSLIALFAILGLVAVSAYYFVEKKKLAK